MIPTVEKLEEVAKSLGATGMSFEAFGSKAYAFIDFDTLEDRRAAEREMYVVHDFVISPRYGNYGHGKVIPTAQVRVRKRKNMRGC